MSAAKSNQLRDLYCQLDAIRSMAGRCYLLASQCLEQKDADNCDHIQQVANGLIARILKETNKQPLDVSSTGKGEQHGQ